MSEAQLRAVLGEIEARAVSSQRELGRVSQHLQATQRQARLLALTETELAGLPADTRLYEGRGKMFLLAPRADVASRLGRERAATTEQATALEKKLEYLQRTYDNARLHMQAALGRPGTEA